MKMFNIAVVSLLVISAVSIIFGNELGAVEILYKSYDRVDIHTHDRTAIFEIDTATYGISFLVVLITISALAGIRFLGSGLADTSIRALMMIAIYGGLWAILSILSIDLLFLNKLVGTLVYLFLCIFYMIGVAGKISGDTIGSGE